MEIKIIPHNKIDKVKWNSCVHYATNGNIFGYKWYLDAVAKEWDGLVEGDYESVLPLFVTEKPDLLEQPGLLREAGIYSIHLLSQNRVQAFLEAIPRRYVNVRIQLNEGTPLPEDTGYHFSEIKNHQLVLLDAYDKIAEKFAPNTRSLLQSPNLKKLLPSSNVKPEAIARIFKDNAPVSTENETYFHAYQRIMYNALHRGVGATFGVTDLNKNLLSASFFIYGQGRMMQLVTATNPKGERLGAYEFLIDNVLRSHAGRPIVLDFNSNSDVPKFFGAEVNYFLKLEKGEIDKKVEKKSWSFW